MMRPFSHLKQELYERQQLGLYRQRLPLRCDSSRTLWFEGRRYLNFSSNDYLGLSHHPKLLSCYSNALKLEGAGGSSSPLITGYSPAHQTLETQLAHKLNSQAALLFSSGFAANQALIKALLTKQHCLWQDRLNHASLLEAGAMSPARQYRFRHNDTQHLEHLLDKGQGLVVTEGVFSMDGDLAPLGTIADLCRRTGNWLMVDDAHGFGVLGPGGQGAVAAQNVSPENIQVQLVTFGKALGVAGAALVGAQDLIDYLVNFARHYLYSTAFCSAQAAAVNCALDILAQEALPQRLSQNIALFRQEAARLGLPFLSSASAIQPLMTGSHERTQMLCDGMRQAGFWLCGIRPPAVPVGQSRVRLTLSAAHTQQDILSLLEQLERCWIWKE